MIAIVGITDEVHRAVVLLAEGGDPKDTVAGISPNRFRGCPRKSVPAVCPLRPRGTALVASSPLRNVVPRCGFGSGYGHGFYSARGEAAAEEMGVKRISIPNHSSKSPDRKKQQKKRWFRDGQKWRTGCEGRISVVKRRHGLIRCRYKGEDGMRRWVGLGVIGDTLINIGRALARRRT